MNIRTIAAGLAFGAALGVSSGAAVSLAEIATASPPVVLYGYYQEIPDLTPPTRLDLGMPGRWSVARQRATCLDLGGTPGRDLPGRAFGIRCIGVDW